MESVGSQRISSLQTRAYLAVAAALTLTSCHAAPPNTSTSVDSTQISHQSTTSTTNYTPTNVIVAQTGSDARTAHPTSPDSSESITVPLKLRAAEPVEAAVDMHVKVTPESVSEPMQLRVESKLTPTEAIPVRLKVEVIPPDPINVKVKLPDVLEIPVKLVSSSSDSNVHGQKGETPNERCCCQLYCPRQPDHSSKGANAPGTQKDPSGPDVADAERAWELKSLWRQVLIIFVAGFLGGLLRTEEMERMQSPQTNTLNIRGRLRNVLSSNDLLLNVGWGWLAAVLVPAALEFSGSHLLTEIDLPKSILPFFGICILAATLGAEFFEFLMRTARKITSPSKLSAEGNKPDIEP